MPGATIGSPPVRTTCGDGMPDDLADDLVDGQRFPLGLPGGVGRVAPGAAQVAAGRADEDRRHARELAFALDRMEYFGDQHRISRIVFRARPSGFLGIWRLGFGVCRLAGGSGPVDA